MWNVRCAAQNLPALKNTHSSTFYLHSPKISSLNHTITFFPLKKRHSALFLELCPGNPCGISIPEVGCQETRFYTNLPGPSPQLKDGTFLCSTLLGPSAHLCQRPPCPAYGPRFGKMTFMSHGPLLTLVSTLETILAAPPPMGPRRNSGFALEPTRSKPASPVRTGKNGM